MNQIIKSRKFKHTKKIAVFGGTFDPIHNGHLLVASECIDKLKVNQVIFTPLNIPNYEKSQKISSGSNRIKMIELAINNHDKFLCSDIEISRGGITYTVETISEFLSIHKDAEILFLISNEWLPKLKKWKDHKNLFEITKFIIINRSTENPINHENEINRLKLNEINAVTLNVPKFEISSTEIRKRISNKETIDFLVPPSVASYIYQKKLYINNENNKRS